MIKDIVIVGAGGFAKEVSLLIDIINQTHNTFNKIGIIDLDLPKGAVVGDLQVIGNNDDLNLITRPVDVVFAVAIPQRRKLINQLLTNKLLNYPNIIHPEIDLNNHRTNIGVGNIITEGCIVSCDIIIGNFNVFNNRVSLGHDVKVGNYNVFNPNTQISGAVTIRDANLFGVNSCVLQGISIGSDNVIGACSLLTRRIKDGKTYFGVPAKTFE